MTDDERVQEIRQRINGSCRWRDVDILFLLDKLAEAEARGMEQAAEIVEMGDLKPQIPRREIAEYIRASAEKLKK